MHSQSSLVLQQQVREEGTWWKKKVYLNVSSCLYTYMICALYFPLKDDVASVCIPVAGKVNG